jgi:hypothetical protein
MIRGEAKVLVPFRFSLEAVVSKPASPLVAVALAVAWMLPVIAGAQTVIAKKGTIVYGTLLEPLNSKTNHNGDKFTLSEHDSWFHHNPELKGGIIEGHIENVSPASATHKATMSVIFDDIKLPDGSLAPIHAQILSAKVFEPQTHIFRDTGIILGAAVVGHMVGSKMGQQHGGLAGGAAGFALVSTMKSDIKLSKGTIIKLKLTEDATTVASQ